MNQTQIAVLGTLAEFHQEPIPYDLNALVQLVADIHPDLLCLDIAPSQWQAQDFSSLPPEYAQALLPLAYQTDIVVAPVGDLQELFPAEAAGWRGGTIRLLRHWLGWLQRTAPSPDAINQGWRHHIGNLFYTVGRWLAGKQVQMAYHDRIEAVTASILDVAQHNPGNRILVVTNIQYCHHIRPWLAQHPEIEIRPYTKL